MDETIFIAGPEPSLKLIHSDVWLPGLYSRRILCFALPPSSSHAKEISVIQRGLEALVQGTPELGGISVVVPAAEHDGKVPWRALASYKGIELVIKDMTKTFTSYTEFEKQDFPLKIFKDADFMPIPGPIMPEPQPNAKFQISLIEGGLLLSVRLYHHLTDGNGMNAITRALAEECAKAAQTDSPLAPRVLDTSRTPLLELNGSVPDLAKHPAYRITPGIFAPGAHHDHPEPTGPPPVYAPGYFRLSNAAAEALKQHCSAVIPVSTHDAVCALLWRTLIAVRTRLGKVDATTTSFFTQPHDGRRHVALPKFWVGNCVYFVLAGMRAGQLAQTDSLAAAAAAVREQLKSVNHDAVADIWALRREDPYSLNWWPVFEHIDRHVVAITSFYRSDLLGVDFGAAPGPVRHFTTTDIGALGADLRSGHSIGPRFVDGKGCDVYVGLLEAGAELFAKDELWSRYFTPLEHHLGNGSA